MGTNRPSSGHDVAIHGFATCESNAKPHTQLDEQRCVANTPYPNLKLYT